jgi:hypothetical protein
MTRQEQVRAQEIQALAADRQKKAVQTLELEAGWED